MSATREGRTTRHVTSQPNRRHSQADVAGFLLSERSIASSSPRSVRPGEKISRE